MLIGQPSADPEGDNANMGRLQALLEAWCNLNTHILSKIFISTSPNCRLERERTFKSKFVCTLVAASAHSYISLINVDQPLTIRFRLRWLLTLTSCGGSHSVDKQFPHLQRLEHDYRNSFHDGISEGYCCHFVDALSSFHLSFGRPLSNCGGRGWAGAWAHR